MKRLALAVSIIAFSAAGASAADMAVKAPPMAAPVLVYNWSGIYIGLNAGYGWGGNTNQNIAFTDPGIIGFAPYFAGGGNVFPGLKPQGFIGGGQIGADRQWGKFVAGVVADFQGTDIKASATATATPGGGFVPSTQTLTQRLDFLGTARVRGGFAANNWLFYGTGGLAYGQVNSSLTFNALPASPVFLTNSNTENRVGWAAGAGVNYGFTNWVVGLEWLHYDLGRSTVTAFTVAPGVIVPGGSLTGTQRVAGDIVRGTVSYKFNWSPVVAKY
jgi:outer membrane immunogenic protein